MYSASCLVLCNDTHLATTHSRMTYSHQVTIEAIQGLEPVGIVALMIDIYTSTPIHRVKHLVGFADIS